MIYPCDNERVTPPDFVPKLSQVACVLQCGGIWLGQKGWGVTWKLIQCVVKPREVVSVYGQCRVMLTDDERGAIATQNINEDDDAGDSVFTATETAAAAPASAATHSVEAEDSDEEQEEMPEIVAAPTDVVEDEPAPVLKKKLVKKKVAPVEEEPAPVMKKKVVKKKKVVEAEA